MYFQEKSRNEIKVLTAEKGKLKHKLDEFYQKQSEVRTKLKFEEFQQQLDAAKLWFRDRLEHKRTIISKNAAKKIRSFQNKYPELFQKIFFKIKK